jgi:mutator protein MutT
VSAPRYRVLVVAGVIRRDGLYLIGQRKNGDSHAFKWEFPGGKVERGESPREALARELREELGIRARVGREIARYEHQDNRRSPILLIFHAVEAFDGEPAPGEFEQIRWERPDRLPDYDFLDGDLDFVRRLARGQIQP